MITREFVALSAVIVMPVGVVPPTTPRDDKPLREDVVPVRVEDDVEVEERGVVVVGENGLLERPAISLLPERAVSGVVCREISAACAVNTCANSSAFACDR